MYEKLVKFVRKKGASKSRFLMTGYHGDRYLFMIIKVLFSVEKEAPAK